MFTTKPHIDKKGTINEKQEIRENGQFIILRSLQKQNRHC